MPVNPEDIKIEGNVAVWDMKEDGVISGTYMGTFRFRCYLTPLQQIQAGREERDMLGQNIALAPEHERFLAYALSQLKQRIVSAPPFWISANPNGNMPGDLPDEEIIANILDAAQIAQRKYKFILKNRKDSAIKDAKLLAEQFDKEEREQAAKLAKEFENES